MESQTVSLPMDAERQIAHTDRFWQSYRRGLPVVEVVTLEHHRLPQVECDVVILGGTLGIVIGCALQRRGWRVAVIERSHLRGRAQEWNLSRAELEPLRQNDLLTEAELETAIASEYNPARIGFYGGSELWVRDILNIGIDPVVLLHTLKEKFLSAGGHLCEVTEFKHLAIHPNGVAVQTDSQAKPRSAPLTGRLLLDAMGHFSPIARQARRGASPDGICWVVGGCAHGIPNCPHGDLFYTFSPCTGATQDFWEAFPARDGRTTYLFRYGDLSRPDHTFAQMIADYTQALPGYQQVAGDRIKLHRLLMGFFPSFRDSPWRSPWPRVVPVGDSSGLQSPLSFGGFGAMVRHLPRLTDGIHDALHLDYLGRDDVRALVPYQPNISITWLFQQVMCRQPQMVNRLLDLAFTQMASLGEPVYRPFLQDALQWQGLTQTMVRMAIADAPMILRIAAELGIPNLLDWFGHYVHLGRYTFLANYCSPGFEFHWQRQEQSWRYGAGLDSVASP
ncbi:MAG: FAD-binding oxidoreductase [Oscillatoriales cyanobacterium SM2_2_1]|nr:FAD-binding oxidoreductase [Oscillatoriales cyanobacterium SM2_2_1]